MFFPSDRQVGVTDGSVAPGPTTAPGATLRDLTQWWRSGGDISSEQKRAMRGVAGRPVDEYLYVRRATPSISDIVFEWDDAANGPAAVFDMLDARTGVLRVYQVTYRTGFSRAVQCLQGMVSDSFQDEDVMLYNVSLTASGAMAEMGF